MKHRVLLFLACAEIVAACAPPQYISSGGGDEITESLFTSKDATLSEEKVQLLLNGRVQIPDSIRLAVFNYQNYLRVARGYFDVHDLQFREELLNSLKSKLHERSQVASFRVLTGLMVPQEINLVTLREAAVRLQADQLLVLSIRNDSYYRSRLFNHDRNKVVATAEAMVMDIRTGIIVYSEIFSEVRAFERGEKDINSLDFKQRVALEVEKVVTDRIGTSLKAFYDSK